MKFTEIMHFVLFIVKQNSKLLNESRIVFVPHNSSAICSDFPIVHWCGRMLVARFCLHRTQNHKGNRSNLNFN